MHGGHEEQTGAIAQNEAAANFERLGWGPIPNHLHDRGTDFILQVRDERNVDLGLLAGAQIKGGSAGTKRRSLWALADLVDRVPPEIRPRLTAIARRMARREGAVVPGFFSTRDAAGEAVLLAAAIGALDEAESADLLACLLADETDRLFAAAVAARSEAPGDLGMLVALAGDPSPDVRAQAAAGLARRVANDEGGVLALRAMQACLDDPGTRVPHAIATTLSTVKTLAAGEVRESLRDHRSARVRRAYRASRERPTTM